MFIAMNRFRVKPGSESDFEAVWLNREVYLDGVPGFVEFHLLRGPRNEDHTLYSSHTIWRSKADLEAWTRSEAFRNAHRGPAATSRSTSAIRSSRASRSCRPFPPSAHSRAPSTPAGGIAPTDDLTVLTGSDGPSAGVASARAERLRPPS
jgi:heme-degrading monooxygenase HmoA